MNAHLVGDVAQRLHPSLIGLLVVGHLQKGGRVDVSKAARAGSLEYCNSNRGPL